MSKSNKVLIIGASVALGVIAVVALGVGWMQFVSFRNEQAERAEAEEREARQEALNAISAECRDLRRIVNQTGDFMQEFEAEIQVFSDNASQVETLQDIKSAATEYTDAVDTVVVRLDGLTSELESKTYQDETLKGFQSEYTKVVKGFRTSLLEAGQAMNIIISTPSEAELPSRIDKSQEQTMAAVSSIEELSNTEDKLISDVNAYCEETNIERNELQTTN
ncbi:hypothetical protein XM38_012230 [Halomicronema hongdechloris C2206]|uniref:Uncharacterized protein n=1 Tax=Halomicronema hongdechloris C2206 TaxID=1641165 RepID=A0A1Z3HJ49_9CYAN|nr:hypothetical protein [Halomicronema hongdechloris]ASC70286.1 hypothetical protein XM38_012230 [Halomicronema hongdechloris C2206]